MRAKYQPTQNNDELRKQGFKVFFHQFKTYKQDVLGTRGKRKSEEVFDDHYLGLSIYMVHTKGTRNAAIEETWLSQEGTGSARMSDMLWNIRLAVELYYTGGS